MNHSTRAMHLRLGAFAMIALLSGCASGPTIISNSSPDFDLSDHSTFSFMRPLSTDNGNVRSLLSSELIDATQPQLEAAGLRFAETGGDLLINFGLVTQETIETRTTPQTGMSAHHRRGRYGVWRGYSMTASTTTIIQRTEGTLVVDVVDASRQELVWEGAASGRVTDRDRENRAAVIDAAIADIFKKFP